MSVNSGSERVRVAVVLSAGGLRGAAHVGVLRQLVRHGIPIDVIVGVSASASIPRLFPAVPILCGQEECLLTDGGVSDPVPLAFARRPAIAATHVIVSDCRWCGTVSATDEKTVWIRPRLASTGTLWAP